MRFSEYPESDSIPIRARIDDQGQIVEFIFPLGNGFEWPFRKRVAGFSLLIGNDRIPFTQLISQIAREKIIFRLISQALRDFFYIDYAPNGRDGLCLFLRNDYDLVITDFDMPFMNGREMIEEIKRVDEFCPIIIITGSQLDFEYKDVQVFYKPFALDILKRFIMEYLAV